MEKLLRVLGLVLLMLVFPTLLVAGDPGAQTYLVDRYSNNTGPGTTMDQLLRLINVSTGGTPLTTPVGDVCANIYVFDSQQEMISCCSCRLTPNELVTASVANELTNNPLVAVIPTAGVVKIMPTAAGTDVCSPTAPAASSDASLLAGFSTHLETSGPVAFITETKIPVAALSSDEAAFLTNACTFVQYLGGGYGRGTCGCTGKIYGISGTISGAGGSRATVTLSGAATAIATADAAGNYAFTGLKPGSYTVTPSKAGFAFTPPSLPVTVTTEMTGVNFSTVTYSISGTITGAGGDGATVNLAGPSSASVTADASGHYIFAGLQNGSYTVTPSKTGFIFTPASQPVAINQADMTANFSSAALYSISGTISGAGGAGATVNLSGASSATVVADAYGNFTFSGVGNGTYSVRPSQYGFTFTPASQNVTVNTANVTAVNFDTVTYSVSGTLSGPGSNGATVTLTGATTATVAADASGNYTLTGLNSGSYTVTPGNTGFTFSPDSQPVTINGGNVTGVKFSSFRSCPCSLWTSTTVPGTLAADDSNPIELGVRLSSDVAGFITGVRFYKDATNSGKHIAHLWTNTGTLLATAKFTNETDSGWQQVDFANPVPLAANTMYVASYHTNAGNYSYDENYFTSAFDNNPLHARKDGMSGANGVYIYGSSAFPTSTYSSTNYYVDVVFSTAQSISGTISGPGGSGATVTLSGPSSTSVTADASGNYTFDSVVNGDYTVTPSNPGFTFAPASRAVTTSGADLAAVNFTSSAGLAIDQVISGDHNSPGNTITSPAFSTGSANELLLALISTDGSSAGITVTGVSSTHKTLTWSLVQRTNTQLGTAEIWRAFSSVPLSETSVSATLSQGVAASITVVTFTGVDTSTTDGSGAIGATASTNAHPGAPTASLTTTRNGSWVIGVGNDWDSATSRTVGANQTVLHQFLAAHGDTFWVQSQTGTTPLAGTVVTINDTAPTGDRYNLSICEVLPAP